MSNATKTPTLPVSKTDPQWYKDAIIYQLHVKAFADSNGDGIGDFPGLTSRLDYLQELGVNTLWLLPFYPSPLRDDGYDIADYRNINPSYGTMADFKKFIREAHKRGLRVITELVINHTSDQHPWFQRALKAKKGSKARDFYVWSDTDQKYEGTRIIFNDTETSNWAWNPVAKQYYWHRFFSHQPDLNFDNPRVLDEIIKVMYYWLDMGVDGLRLDAVPYLVEREGTSNENLPETHRVIKRIRAALDERYPDRLLLAEANMWPEDVLDYFGDGDECHMAFHFPLMPRIFMALAQEDRHPVTDIMHQTPDIPENCQWATFLRNHDELTLEMVTDRERDYLWNFYAADRRARINFGIRRRLAPLMENDRRKIELMKSLLMSMPGTPILYYGDEIGMGDNIFLGDRNGVRTPMQWSPDRNGGFSGADPAKLYLPAIMDPIYGFQALNVEAQRRVQNSLLNWTRRLINVVKTRTSFSRGTLRFFTPQNRKVLAYMREFEGEKVLCVANLSHSPQPCELNLQEFSGYRPLEMLGQSIFPRIGELPYFLTLPAYSFYWFLLEEPSDEHLAETAPLVELYTLVTPEGWLSLTRDARARKQLEEKILPQYLMHQRWYKSKGHGIPKVEFLQRLAIVPDMGLALLSVTPPNEPAQYYNIALGIAWEDNREDPATRLQRCALARVRQGAKVGVLYEASHEETLVRALMDDIRHNRTLPVGGQGMRLLFRTVGELPEVDLETVEIHSMGVEQSNTSIIVGDDMILKLIRQPHAGISPELEIGEYLTTVQPFANTPPLLGSVEIEGFAEKPITVALLDLKVTNQGDGWKFTLGYLERFIDEIRLLPENEMVEHSHKHDFYTTLVRVLGQRTGELHRAFSASSGLPAFEPEPITAEDRKRWIDRLRRDIKTVCVQLGNLHDRLPESSRESATRLLDYCERLPDLADSLLPKRFSIPKTRIHGDYHLGQVLVSRNDFYIIDFEGEPARTPEERRNKQSPLKDVAGMLRSLDYAAGNALHRAHEAFGESITQLYPGIRGWREEAMAAFLEGYKSTAPALITEKPEEMQALLDFFIIEKAIYEIRYEAENRPDWLRIPVEGLLGLLERREI